MTFKDFSFKTYVIHAKSGYEFHGDRVKKLFGEIGLDFEFVSDATPENFTHELLHTYLSDKFLKKQSKGSTSLTLNHFLSYERLLESSANYAIVFEDDPCFLGDFEKKFNELLPHIKALNPGWIISLENTSLTFPSFSQTKKNKKLYAAKRGRMAGAYVIDRQFAEKALYFAKKNKCDEVIDWFHNVLIAEKQTNMFWAHPPLTEQGSHNGMLSSTVSSKKQSNARKITWAVRKFIKYTIGRIPKQKRIID